MKYKEINGEKNSIAKKARRSISFPTIKKFVLILSVKTNNFSSKGNNIYMLFVIFSLRNDKMG